MDSISSKDLEYANAMRSSSERLTYAINQLRSGIIVETPKEPKKLPPKWTPRGESNLRDPQRHAKNRKTKRMSKAERSWMLFQEGKRNKEIAAIMKISTQKVTHLIAAERVRFRADQANRDSGDELEAGSQWSDGGVVN